MSALRVVSLGEGMWEIAGQELTSPDAAPDPEWLITQVMGRVSGPGPWPVTVVIGGLTHQLLLGIDGSVTPDTAAESAPLAVRKGRFQRRQGVNVALIAVAAVVLLAGAIAGAAVVAGGSAVSAVDTAEKAVPAVWHVDAAPGDVSVAAAGVLVTAGPGKGQVFSLADGRPVETVELPAGIPRVIPGGDWVAVIVSNPDGTNTGFVASEAGVARFQAVKGAVVSRGTDPFLLTGSGKDQGALVWDGKSWQPVAAPEPGMAPVAVSKAGVLWLGAKGRMILGTTTATLAGPTAEAKATGWIWADEKAVAVLWATAAGQVLAVHAVADGKVTGQIPVEAEIRKDAGLVVSGQMVYSLDSGTPVRTEACAAPVLAAGLVWCGSSNAWAAEDARPLAVGESPVPSPADVVVTASVAGFTAYARDEITSTK